MSYKSEKDVKEAVKKIMGRPVEKLWWYMPAANGFGTPGIPDFMGCAYGKTFAIECKFGAGKRTAWQEKQADALNWAGAQYWLVSEKNIEGFTEAFSKWFREASCS
jgi:hypothetical protein